MQSLPGNMYMQNTEKAEKLIVVLATESHNSVACYQNSVQSIPDALYPLGRRLKSTNHTPAVLKAMSMSSADAISHYIKGCQASMSHFPTDP